LFSPHPASVHAKIQFAALPEIQAVQDRLFRDHLSYILSQSPYYRERIDASLAKRLMASGLEALGEIPFTTKDDLLRHNAAFIAAPQQDFADICLTSATSGAAPTMMRQTQSDLARLAYNEEQAFLMTGLGEKDTLIVCAALDRAFMAGLAYFLGGVNCGACVVRSGSGSAAQHWQIIKQTGATAIVGVPSLMRRIAEYAIQHGDDPKKVGVTRLIAIGEALRDRQFELLPLGKVVEELWDAHLYSTYASTEIAATFCECEARQGGHIRPELVIAEIVDAQGRALPPGEEGELVVTPLGVTGMPLIRFKTGDISFLIDAPCSCGRTTQRLGPILGRRQQMLKYKGTTVYPNTILAALEGNRLYRGGYVEALRNADGTDHIILHLAADQSVWPRAAIENELRAHLRVVPEIVCHSAEEIESKVNQPEKKRKRVTFFDLREVKPEKRTFNPNK
jgi:phenylacetate-CoA ligase